MRVLVICFFFFLFSSCRKENRFDCFKGNGKEVTETRRLTPFMDVEVFDKIDLFVKPGTDHKVEIEAGEKLISNIKTEVKGNLLIIDNINTCNFVRGYKRRIKITVTMPYLRYLRNSGVGPAIIEDFNQDTLVVRAESSGDITIRGTFKEIRTSSHGNGDMYVHGRSNTFYIYSNGTNFVHAENLKVRDFTFVHSQTLGDCIVNGDSLNVFACNIESQGNVYLHGTPRRVVDYSEEGVKGRLIRQ